MEGGPSTSITAGKEDLVSWNEDAEKALGNICLHLHPTIGYQFNDATSPSELWETLEDRDGAVGMTQAFIKFKAIMDTTIPQGVDLSPALDKIMSHHTCLINMKWAIPDEILGMMLISKAPPSMETIVQLFSQLLTNAPEKKVKEELVPERIVRMMRRAWNTTGRVGTKASNQQWAQKLSAVKPATNQPPSFQQQQRGNYQQQQRQEVPSNRGGWGLGGGSRGRGR